jgi:hypothetical protein
MARARPGRRLPRATDLGKGSVGASAGTRHGQPDHWPGPMADARRRTAGGVEHAPELRHHAAGARATRRRTQQPTDRGTWQVACTSAASSAGHVGHPSRQRRTIGREATGSPSSSADRGHERAVRPRVATTKVTRSGDWFRRPASGSTAQAADLGSWMFHGEHRAPGGVGELLRFAPCRRRPRHFGAAIGRGIAPR